MQLPFNSNVLYLRGIHNNLFDLLTIFYKLNNNRIIIGTAIYCEIMGSCLAISLFISPPNFFNIKKDRLYSISSGSDVINCS